MIDQTWTPYIDGFVYGSVGVFPYFFGSWKVWDKINGEWRAREGSEWLFKTVDEAKVAAIRESIL